MQDYFSLQEKNEITVSPISTCFREDTGNQHQNLSGNKKSYQHLILPLHRKPSEQRSTPDFSHGTLYLPSSIISETARCQKLWKKKNWDQLHMQTG